MMATCVSAPLERQFGEMPGLKQMASVSSGGGSVITLEFKLDENIEVAEQEVWAAIDATRGCRRRNNPLAAKSAPGAPYLASETCENTALTLSPSPFSPPAAHRHSRAGPQFARLRRSL